MVLLEAVSPDQALAWLKEATEKKEAKAEGIKTASEKPLVFMDLGADGTPLGRVVVELNTDKAPLTCANFLALCTGSHKGSIDNRLHYRNTMFHRIIPSLYLCAGDVVNNNGTSGLSIYGETFPDEKTGLKHDEPGVLSMLGHGPNTNSSQFFISLTPSPWMDEFYVVFGKVVSGLELLAKISELYGTESGVPTSDNLRVVECGQLR